MKYPHIPTPCKKRPAGFIEGHILARRPGTNSPSVKDSDFTHAGVTLSVPYELQSPKATPLELLALLLLAVPSELTLQKLVALLPDGERSHQFEAG